MNTFLAVEEVHVGVILLCMRSRITFFSRFSDYSFAVCVLIPFFIPDVKQTDSLLEGDEAEDPSHNSARNWVPAVVPATRVWWRVPGGVRVREG